MSKPEPYQPQAATNNGPWERGKNQRVPTGTHKTAPVAPDVANSGSWRKNQANSLSAQSNFYRGSKSNNNKSSNF